MWRSFFLALGITAVSLGVEALAVDKAVLNVANRPNAAGKAATQRVISPPEWAPWSLMSAGTVVMLYSFTIPARGK
jgi:hypothetical protein